MWQYMGRYSTIVLYVVVTVQVKYSTLTMDKIYLINLRALAISFKGDELPNNKASCSAVHNQLFREYNKLDFI